MALVSVFFHLGGLVMAVSPSGDIIGKVMCGYQGWFSCAGDGAPIGGWSHYCNSGTPSPTNCIIPCWPDVRDYAAVYQTAFPNLGNGQPAGLYSPWDQQTVTVQFQWMQQNGIDGVGLQRFGSWTTPGSSRKAQVDGIAVRVRNAAEATGRKFYIMYDCSATDALEADWTDTIVNTLHLTASSSYAFQNGKPVVCFWGVGKSGRGNPSDWVTKIKWFKNQGCYVIGGTLVGWQGGTTNMPAFNACDMISPWMIGVISTPASSDNAYTNHTLPDLTYCNARGMDYQPCVIPGGGGQRIHGDLMWREFYNVIRAGCQAIYISMFDEYNEGNQIAKTAESAAFIPAGSSFETLDLDGTACSADYYLRLTGDGCKMLKGQIALTSTRPTLPALPAALPAAPTGLCVNGANAQITLNWAPSPGAAQYTVKRSLVKNGPYTIMSTNVGNVSYTDTGITNGTTYYYVVSAVNSAGESPNSAETNGMPCAVAISASGENPPNETAAQAFDGSTATKWLSGGGGPTGWLKYYFGGPAQTLIGYSISSANDMPGRDPKNWQFQGSHNGSTWVTLDTRTGETFASRLLTKQYTINSPGAYEYYRLYVTANNGDSINVQLSELAFVYLGKAAPAAPTGLTAKAVSSSQINLNWAASPGATSYNIKRASGGSGIYACCATGVTGTNYNDNGNNLGDGANSIGLQSATTYSYVVSALNANGEGSDSLSAAAVTGPLSVPEAPSGLTLTPGSGQVGLVWNLAPRASSYNVKRGTSSGGPYATITNGLTVDCCFDASLTNATTYYYVVTAANAAGESSNSAEVSFTLYGNLALNRPVTVSSTSGGYQASNAVDGNTSTRWSSAYSDPQWIYVDLETNYNITRVKLTWETAYGKAYQIQVSSNATSWTTLYSTTTAAGGVNDLTGLSGCGRYVRMYGTTRGTGYGYSLWEFEVYGVAPPPATPSLVAPRLHLSSGGNYLQFDWPADHLGWRLEAQTNLLAVGIKTNWITVSGSAGVTATNLMIDPAKGTVFYRLVYP